MEITDVEYYKSKENKLFPVFGRYGNYALIKKNGELFCSLDKNCNLDIGKFCVDNNLAPASIIMSKDEYKRINELYSKKSTLNEKIFNEESLDLASKISIYMYEYDSYSYNDSIKYREQVICKVAKEIRESKVDYIINYLKKTLYENQRIEDIMKIKILLNDIDAFYNKYGIRNERTQNV